MQYFLIGVTLFSKILPVIIASIFLLALWSFAKQKTLSLWWVFGYVIFEISFRAVLTIGQYLVWAGNDMTKIFVTSSIEVSADVPDQLRTVLGFFDWQGGYFAFYSLMHFWAAFIVSILFSAA